MAGASNSCYAFDGLASGQYKYKSAKTSLTDKTCKCIMWEGNEGDEYRMTRIFGSHFNLVVWQIV